MADAASPRDALSAHYHFPTIIYTIDKPEFMDTVRAAAKAGLAKTKLERGKADEIYPVYMTGDLLADDRMEPFAGYVGATTWNILAEQGYDMARFVTFFTECWAQEHFKHSAMEQHVHGHGAQIVGFYFLDVPPGSSRVLFHDPKVGKVQTGLPEADPNAATAASNIINFEPKPGMLMFANAWLAHSFTRHASAKPLRFVHFNLSVRDAPATEALCRPAEVV